VFTTRRIFLSLAVVVAVSPASTPAQQRGCADTHFPKHLPSVNTILDSAAVAAELAKLQGPRIEMRFGLFFNDGDSLPVILPLSGGHEAIPILNRSLRPQKPSDVWAVRAHLAVGGGNVPVLTIERATYCPPAPDTRVGGIQQTRIMVQVEPDDRMPPSGRARILIEVSVTKNGVPLRVRLLQSSGIRDLDDQVVREFDAKRYLPALLEGVPIDGIYHSDGHSPMR